MTTQHRNEEEHLTEHFTLREMTQSGTAISRNIDNVPTPEQVERLRLLCLHVLEPLRKRFGVIRITSAYRCEQLNRAVGGVAHSQHLNGEAADIHVSSRAQALKMYDYIKQHLDYDQLLLERKLRNGCYWLHVSYVLPTKSRRNRHDSRILTV